MTQGMFGFWIFSIVICLEFMSWGLEFMKVTFI